MECCIPAIDSGPEQRYNIQYTQSKVSKPKNTSGRCNKLPDQGQKRTARCWAPQHRAVHARELTKGCDDYPTGNAMPPKPFRTLRTRYTAYLGLTTWGLHPAQPSQTMWMMATSWPYHTIPYRPKPIARYAEETKRLRPTRKQEFVLFVQSLLILPIDDCRIPAGLGLIGRRYLSLSFCLQVKLQRRTESTESPFWRSERIARVLIIVMGYFRRRDYVMDDGWWVMGGGEWWMMNDGWWAMGDG